jgi:putative antitoxin of VapBC-like toxin-antitoxin system
VDPARLRRGDQEEGGSRLLRVKPRVRGAVATVEAPAADYVVCHTCGGSHMPTNLALDPKLIDKALKVSGEKTKEAAVTRALQEFIARREQRRILHLFATLEWDPTYDYKKERSR